MAHQSTEPRLRLVLHELAEELVDLEDSVQQWRFRHAKAVARIVGHRRKALDIVLFPESWEVRTRP